MQRNEEMVDRYTKVLLTVIAVALACLWRPDPMWGAETYAQTTAPIFRVSNMANQASFYQTLSMVGATIIISDASIIPACEMLDDNGSIVGAAVLLVDGLVEGRAIWCCQSPRGLSIELDPATGHIDFVYYWDDSATVPSIEEYSDIDGIISITYRAMPIGPIIGKWYVYRPLLWERMDYGKWRLVRSTEESLALLTVGPPYAANVVIGGSSGTLATFFFYSPIGADQAIVQVVRDPDFDFPPDQTYQQTIPGSWTGMDEHAVHSVQVDLSQVPGTANLYYWRIGARSSENAGPPRSYPGGQPDGWVWSKRNCFRYETGRFVDIPTLHWAYSEIEACADAGIVAGYDDGLYHGDWPVTRDQMAVYISRCLAGGDENVPGFTETPSFPDVPEGDWALDYVEYAAEQNVVAGYGDGNYHPEYDLTRAEMAVYVARALVAPTGEAALADYVSADPRNFPDAPETGHGDDGTEPYWAYTHIEYCVENGVVQGYGDGYYRPHETVTRAQMAVYIARAFSL